MVRIEHALAPLDCQSVEESIKNMVRWHTLRLLAPTASAGCAQARMNGGTCIASAMQCAGQIFKQGDKGQTEPVSPLDVNSGARSIL